MYLKSVLQMGSLMLHFRNGASLVQQMRAAEPSDAIVLWDGTRIAHPAQRAGLLEAVQEIWLEHAIPADFTGQQMETSSSMPALTSDCSRFTWRGKIRVAA